MGQETAPALRGFSLNFWPAFLALALISGLCGSLIAQEKQFRPEVKKSEDGVRYVSTGVGYDSRVNLPRFSLRLIFSTKNQKYLAEIDTEITPGPTGKPTIIHAVGPWLDVDLPPGKYKVKARTSKGHEVNTSFEVIQGRLNRVKLVWNITDEEI